MYTQDNKEIYAGFFVRLIAFWVDSIVAGCIAMIIRFPLNMISNMGSESILTENFVFHHSVIDVIGYIIVVMYFILTTYYTHTTLGKYLFKLRVENVNDEWTFMNIVYRETIGRFLSSLLCIGYIVLAIDSEKRGFHDMLSDTRVVYSMKMVERRVIQPVQPRPNQMQQAPNQMPNVPSTNHQQDGNDVIYCVKND